MWVGLELRLVLEQQQELLRIAPLPQFLQRSYLARLEQMAGTGAM
jgi:hypothetical protein